MLPFLKKITNYWSLLCLAVLAVFWAMNSFSLSFVISFWTLGLYLATKIPKLEKTRAIRAISKEVGLLSLIYTLVTLMPAFTDAQLDQKKEATALFIADDYYLIDLIATKRHDPTTALKHYAYWRYSTEWNKSKSSIRSILSGLTKDNSTLFEDTIVNPSLFGFFSSKVTSSNEALFSTFKRDELSLRLPRYNSIKLEESHLSLEGKVCDFTIITTNFRPEIYSRQWVQENEMIAMFQSKHHIENFKVLLVRYSLELKCPWYHMFHPTVPKYHRWFSLMSSEYTKQMNWNEIRAAYIQFEP